MKNNTILLMLAAISLISSKTHAANGRMEVIGASDSTAVAAADTAARRGFVGRIINYFADSNDDKSRDKKIDFSIIGGPHYSSDIKVGLGIVAAGLYHTDRNDSLSVPSNISFTGDFSTTGFWLLGIRGNTFFKQAKYRLDYNAYFYSMPSKFWGIGYDMGRDDGNESKYKHLKTQFKVDFMHRIAKNMYVGVSGSFNYVEGKDFDKYIDLGHYLDGQKISYLNTGTGLFVLHDSRDYITSAHKGWYFKIENLFFPGFMGNKLSFNRTELTLNHYHRVWEGGVMAYDLYAQYNDGDVPWTMMALMGDSRRMRGYYEGRYRDKSVVSLQAELRQKVWRRIGMAVWGGAGNVFRDFGRFNISNTLPNYGLGVRWEFKNRVNVRFDYGMGKGQSGFIFNINEAF